MTVACATPTRGWLTPMQSFRQLWPVPRLLLLLPIGIRRYVISFGLLDFIPKASGNIFSAPTTSLWHSKPQFLHFHHLPFGFFFKLHSGHWLEVPLSEPLKLSMPACFDLYFIYSRLLKFPLLRLRDQDFH